MPMPMPMLAACSKAKQECVCSSSLRAHWSGNWKLGRLRSGRHKDGPCRCTGSQPCNTASVQRLA